jgi:dTDP-4-dehydrorhamnose 3,5-epimerase
VEVRTLAIPEVKLVSPRVLGDERGWFCETYNARTLAEAAGIDVVFVQDNHALSRAKGTLRGLHFQTPPRAQGKLVRVVRGSILDIAVDIRHGSPTFGRHVSAVIDAASAVQIWVPVGFAHGYCTLEPDSEVLYKTTDHYAPDHDKGLRWNDPALAIDWPVDDTTAVVSQKDRAQPLLSELPAWFRYGAG